MTDPRRAARDGGGRSLSRSVTVMCLALTGSAACSPTRDAGEVAVLIGLGSGWAGDKPGAVERYTTVGLTITSEAVRVFGDAPDIVIPLARGFARMGVATLCRFDSTSGVDSTTGWNNYRQVVWRAVDDRSPVVPDDQGVAAGRDSPCRESGAGPEPRDSLPADEMADERESLDEAVACGDIRAQITFAASRYWAEQITHSQTEECEPRGDRWTNDWQVRKASGGETISLLSLFDSTMATAALEAAMVRGLEARTREGFNCPEGLGDPTRWSILHVGGRWTPLAGGDGMGECQFFEPLDLALPDSLMDDSPTGDLWPALRAHVPGVRDYVAAPGAPFVVALTGQYSSKLEVYAIGPGGWRKLWEHPNRWFANVVAVRWGGRREVRRWTGYLRDARAHPPSPRPDSVEPPAR